MCLEGVGLWVVFRRRGMGCAKEGCGHGLCLGGMCLEGVGLWVVFLEGGAWVVPRRGVVMGCV